MLTKKDYFLVSLIGFFFTVFSVPILKNINLPFFPVNVLTIAGLIIFFIIFAPIALWMASLISKSVPVALQVAKFGAVGAFNTFLDWGVLNILIAAVGISAGIYFALFKGISFVISNAGSYFWNKYWTFSSKTQSSTGEVAKFIAVSVVGLVINVLIASVVFNSIASMTTGGFSQERVANIGALVATIVSLVWNFVGYKFLVFVSRKRENVHI